MFAQAAVAAHYLTCDGGGQLLVVEVSLFLSLHAPQLCVVQARRVAVHLRESRARILQVLECGATVLLVEGDVDRLQGRIL